MNSELPMLAKDVQFQLDYTNTKDYQICYIQSKVERSFMILVKCREVQLKDNEIIVNKMDFICVSMMYIVDTGKKLVLDTSKPIEIVANDSPCAASNAVSLKIEVIEVPNDANQTVVSYDVPINTSVNRMHICPSVTNEGIDNGNELCTKYQMCGMTHP